MTPMNPTNKHQPPLSDDVAQSRARLAVHRLFPEPRRSRGGSRGVFDRSLCLVVGFALVVAAGVRSHAHAALTSPRDAGEIAVATDGLGGRHRWKTLRLGWNIQSRSAPPSSFGAATPDAQGGIHPIIGPDQKPTGDFTQTLKSVSSLMKDAPNWALENEQHKSFFDWLEEGVQLCNGTGVTCDENNRVIELDFSGQFLNSTIPTEIGELTELYKLDLPYNILTGTIPTEIGELTKLRILDLRRNELTGGIPEIGKLTELNSLALNGNKITGTIPTEIKKLTKLNRLILASNQLTSTTPTEVGELTKLYELDLHRNKLTGEIPTEIGNLKELYALDLSKKFLLQFGHQLTGTIPTEIGKLKKLKKINLAYNQFTGTIPTEIGELTELNGDGLELHENKLTGAIPTEIGKLTKLTGLLLRFNKLNGAIPTEIGALTGLNLLWLYGNKLTGAIPTEIGKLKKLKKMNLAYDQFTGTIPTEIGELTMLNDLKLNQNKLIGAIPTEIGELTKLYGLYLHENKLTGPIPTQIGELIMLDDLYLNKNELTGAVPTEIEKLTELSNLDLHENKLTGAIPTEIGELTELNNLYLDKNKLNGTIPMQIGELTELISLELDENKLTGTIPTEIQALTKLTTLGLCKNYLTGEIPTEIGRLVYITDLDLSKNELSGPIPEHIQNIPNLLSINVSHNKVSSFPFEKAWPSLKSCDLSHNGLKTVGASFPGLSSVEKLVLSHNLISGRISTQLRSLLRLEWLHLDHNMLSGTIPDDLLSLSRLRELKLSDNGATPCFDGGRSGSCNASAKTYNGGDVVCCNDGPCSKDVKIEEGSFCFPGFGLWGTIPAGFASVPYLTKLDLSGNKLSRNVPPEIGDLSRLRHLDLSDNLLTGKIPSTLGVLVNAGVFLDGNEDLGEYEHKIAPLSLCANVPGFDLSNDTNWCPQERNALKAFYDSAKGQEWTDASGWVNEYNRHCLWHGIECDEEQKVIKILLDNNGLSGRISSRITDLESLSVLDLHDNDLQGSIPEQIGKLTKLSYARFSYNDITGSFPSGLTTLSQLDLLHLHGNRMSGKASDFSFEPHTASSLVADCGSPSDFNTPLICSECTTCCNSLGECHVNTFAMSSSEMPKTTMTWVVMLSTMAFYCTLAATFFLSKKTRAFISTLVFWNNAEGSHSDEVSSSAPGVCSPSKFRVWGANGKNSVYSFLLSTSACGWLVSVGTLAAQAFVFVIFIQAAELDFDDDSKDWVYSWRCPRNSDECNDTSDSLVYGWIVFAILMVAFLACDLINALKLLWNFAVENQLSWENARCFISGLCLFSVTILALLASVVYNIAIARSNTGLITNAVIILFVNDQDEKIYSLLLVVSPKWFCDIMSKVKEARPEELSETQKLIVEEQETINKQHKQEIDQLNAKVAALLESAMFSDGAPIDDFIRLSDV